jgi:hypothetical protein
VRIAERYAPTGERFAVTCTRFARTGAKPELIYASIVRTDAKALRNRSFGRTVMKSELIGARCLVTGVNCARTEVIYVVTDVTFAETAAMRGETDPKPGIGGQGKRVTGKGNNEKTSFSYHLDRPLPLPLYPFPVTLSRFPFTLFPC